MLQHSRDGLWGGSQTILLLYYSMCSGVCPFTYSYEDSIHTKSLQYSQALSSYPQTGMELYPHILPSANLDKQHRTPPRLTQKAPFFHRCPFRVRYKRPAKNPPKTLDRNKPGQRKLAFVVGERKGGQDSTAVGSSGDTYPMNMKRKQAVVINAPRLEGDSIPSIATTGKKGQRTAALMYMC